MEVWVPTLPFAAMPAVTRQRDSLIAAGAIIDRHANRAKRSVPHFVGRIVRDHILSAQISDDLIRDLRQLGNRIRKESAPAGFTREFIDQGDCFFTRALANQPGFFIKLIDKTDHEDLHVFLAQSRKELFLFIETVAVFAVSDHDQRAAPAIAFVAFPVFRNVLALKDRPHR